MVAWCDDSSCEYFMARKGKKTKTKQQTSVVYLAIFAQAHGEDTEMKVVAEWRSLSSKKDTCGYQ